MAEPLPIDALLQAGEAIIAHSRMLRTEFERKLVTHRRAAPDASSRACELVVEHIIERALCESCLVHETRLDPGEISDALRVLGRRFVLARPDEVCAECSSRTVVHLLG